ncbi:MAG: AbrB/MazE/SpoVT family DNA-binding domain-containing protein [Desulfosalsimonadaceae bacterium]
MSAVMKISPQGQIRIPKNLMKDLHIEPGDYFEAGVENGNMVLRPRKLIDPCQQWYWSRQWREKEAEIDEEIEKGEVSPIFHTPEEGLKWLKK